MPFSKWSGLAIGLVLSLGIVSTANTEAPVSARVQAAAEASAAVTSPCSASATNSAAATGSAPATAAAAVSITPTAAATLSVTASATADNSLLQFLSFTPTDIHFNPTPDKPVAVIIVFSLIFQNQLAEPLHIEAPRFKLAIDGVDWGSLASTDFQTGQLPANGVQGIVLQSLTLVNQTTAAQQTILSCLRNQQPVDLTLTGTINAFPGGVKQSVAANFTNPAVIIRAQQPAGQ